jgi:hypothetical protein
MAKVQQYALLVGVTQYPNLPHEPGNDFWLDGPANDVALIKDLLTTKFDFKSEQITTLIGGASEAQQRPTRANIAREFGRLAAIARPGDQIVILLAGHGSQQPTETCELEPDGLDEIFLPEDVGMWNKVSKRVENAILDKEIHQWLAAIRNTGAFIWVLVDSCHSGDITRGTPVERERRIVLAPAEVLTATKEKCAALRPLTHGKDTVSGGVQLALASPSGTPPASGGLVVIAAAQPFEPTPELPLPESNPQASRHGLFSYTLAQVLQQRQSPLTYRELAERVHARYRSMGRFTPTPLLAGDSIDREVLGLQTWPARPTLLLGHKNRGGQATLKAGSVHGLYPGTVLAVYPPAGEADAQLPIGHVRVTRSVEPFTAVVEPVAFGGMTAPAMERLVPGSRCQITTVDYGALRLKVAVQVQTETDSTPHLQTFGPGAGPAAIEDALLQLTRQPRNLVERVVHPTEAAWYIRLVNHGIYLIPSAGWVMTAFRTSGTQTSATTAPPQFIVGNLDDTATLSMALQKDLTRIARAHNLLRIANIDDSVGPLRTEGVDVSVALFDQQAQPIAYSVDGRVLREGDRFTIRLANTGHFHVDVTVLLIDSAYGITAFFPTEFEPNRLGPGDVVPLRFKVTEPFGPEQLVVIATKAEGAVPVNLAYLAQPGLRAPDPETTPRGVATTTLLGQLLDNAMYAMGTTQRSEREHINDYVVRLHGWTTRPAMP